MFTLSLYVGRERISEPISRSARAMESNIVMAGAIFHRKMHHTASYMLKLGKSFYLQTFRQFTCML